MNIGNMSVFHGFFSQVH